jgi:hypothetical protein
MPQIGEGRLRFGRSYIWLNPDPNLGPGTWRLTGLEVDDGDDGPTPSDFYSQASVRADSPGITENQLIYIDDNGQAGLADASSILTARVAGVAVTNAVAGSFVTYTRNQPIDILNVSTVVDDAPTALEQGRYYWLSAVNPGNYTRTPDTTTSGAVLMQVGLALSANEFTIEIQNPVVI